MHKVVPRLRAIRKQFQQEVREILEENITAEVIAAAGIPDRVAAAYVAIEAELRSSVKKLAATMPDELRADPVKHWTDIIKASAAGVTAKQQSAGDDE